MKRILIPLIIIAALAFAGCKKKYSTNCNCPGNNNWSQPTDSLLHATGTVNATTLVEGTTYAVGNTTNITLGWPKLLTCPEVQVSMFLYDGVNNAQPLWQETKNTTANSYQITVPTHYSCITSTDHALLQIMITTLICSGKESVELKLYFKR